MGKNIWTFKKHIIFSCIVAIIPQIIEYISNSNMDMTTIGIIGGADGPTAVFTSSTILKTEIILYKYILFLKKFIFFPVMLVLLILYKPTQFIIKNFFR